MENGSTGVLYICPTPIGNLEDLTDRVKRVLGEVDLVAAEDTRHTRRLLAVIGSTVPMVSYHEHNEEERARELVERLLHGESVGLVSDAGTPGISDPGYRIVRAAVEAGIRVVPLPGPVAAMVALSASGLPTDRFAFYGFVPRRRGEREALLEQVSISDMTSILYETPHRVRQTLKELVELIPGRQVVVARELTKVHEEFLRGTAQEVLASLSSEQERGEFVIIVAPSPDEPSVVDADLEQLPIREQYEVLLGAGFEPREALKVVARGHGLSRSAVYRVIHR